MQKLIWKLRIWKDTKGQDLIEYALMAGFVAVAAGAIMPGVATSISTIFSKISTVMSTLPARVAKPFLSPERERRTPDPLPPGSIFEVDPSTTGVSTADLLPSFIPGNPPKIFA